MKKRGTEKKALITKKKNDLLYFCFFFWKKNEWLYKKTLREKCKKNDVISAFFSVVFFWPYLQVTFNMKC